MKRIVFVSMAVFAAITVITLFSFRDDDKPLNKETTMAIGDKVEVYYFHLTRRCVTCIAVENVTRDALQAFYPDEMSKGTVKYNVLNLDDETTKPVAEKCRVSGQSLLIISGDTRLDITDKGFMYARTDPDLLKSVIKKAIDPLLNSEK